MKPCGRLGSSFHWISGLAAISIAAFSSHDASAEYLGMGVRLHSTVVLGGTARSVYRVYAVFDNPNDVLIAGGAFSEASPLSLVSLNSQGNGPGSNFLDSISGAPGDFVGGNICNAMIGSLGFTPDPLFISGNSYTNDAIQWSTSTPAGIAVNGVSGPFINGGQTLNGLGLAVLQLTVNAGSNVAGTISIVGNQFISGEFVPMVGIDQTFTSVVPEPGALLTLAATGSIRLRRRRV